MSNDAKFRAIFDNALDAILLFDDEGHIVDANPTACQLLGYTYEALLGHPLSMIVSPESLPNYPERLSALKGEGQQIGTTLVQCQDGQTRHVEYRGRANILPHTHLAIFHDITQRISTQQASQENEARYRTILKHFPNGLVALYDHDLRYQIADGEGLAAIGMKPEDLQGKRLRDVFPPEVYERDEPALLAALQGETTESLVGYVGAYFRVLTVPVRDAEGNITGGMVMSQNITELQDAIDELDKLNQLLELTIQTAHLGMWRIDMTTGKVTWNEQQHKIYGITAEEFQNNLDDWLKTVHPDDRDRVDAKFKDLLEKGSIHDIHFRILRPDGDIRHINASRVVQYDADNKPIFMLGINQDITQFVRAENALLESETRYRTLFDGALNPITIYDEDARFVLLNEAAAKGLGLPTNEIIGKKLSDFIPQNHDKTVERIAQIIANGEAMSFEDDVPLQGETLRYLTIAQPIPHLWRPDTTERLVMMHSYDITEQKRAEDALQTSEEVYESLYKAVPIGLFRTTPEGKVLNVNDAFVALFGYPNADAVLQTPVLEFYASPQERDAVIESAEAQDWITYYPKLKRYDGDMFDGEVVMRIYRDESGQPLYYEGSIQNITERRRAEKAEAERIKLALQLDKEREMADIKANLLSILAHEFRTPLAVIQSSTELIVRYSERMDKKQKEDKFNKILLQVSYLVQLIDEVSMLSRAEQNRLPYAPKPTNLAELCQKILDEMSETISEAQTLKLNMIVKHDKAFLDEHLMQMALRNLLSNAIKYSPEGGKIELVVLEYEHEIHFIVIDEGLGIPLKDQSNLFTQFHRASNVGDIRGTGLGLSIVKTIAEQHGGIVTVDSLDGKGSTFTMRLPNQNQAESTT
jgi:PAS domain S-box-containing protein